MSIGKAFKVVAPSGETAWTITYSHPHRPVHRVEGGMSMSTAKGTLPSKELDIKILTSEMPCGVAIAFEFFYKGEMVRRDIRMEVYGVEGAKGNVG
jgi:hypothetical protein